MQGVALGLLAGAGVLLLLARSLAQRHPAWGWVAAFAEAALVGGLADWFAVVALFRRPLGLPIWHTAIVPRRKDNIAAQLGEFVETRLLTPAALRAEVAEGDIASRLAELLQQDDIARRLGAGLLRSAPAVLAALDDERIAAWLARVVHDEIDQLDTARLSARLAQQLAASGQHQRLLDASAAALQRYLLDPEHLDAVAEFLAQALHVDNGIYKAMIKAAAPRATQALAGMLGELIERPDHPWRAELDRWVAEWTAALPERGGWRPAVQEQQDRALASAGAQAWMLALWPRLKARLVQAVARAEADTAVAATQPDGAAPALLERMSALVRQLGQTLDRDDALRAHLNHALADGMATLVRRHPGAAARFLEGQLARWSPEQMSEQVELAIGRDLQFIRLNGTLVGGLVGLALHALERWW
jgi:uncharacterized membrane-anchored protein YjiN (DUF445 family)